MSTVTFSELEHTLSQAGCETAAAQCQATLTGLICAGSPLPEDWISQATGGGVNGDQHLLMLLERLVLSIREDLSEGQMAFDLLLPDDTVALEARAHALAHWCQGFLFGLTVGGIEQNKPLPGEVAEIVSDFATLAEAAHEGDALDEDESAYTELCEYVRVSAHLVFEELSGVPRTRE